MMKNIGGSMNDPHHRYKRNVITISQRGKNTEILNINHIVLDQLKMPQGFIDAFYKQVVKRHGTAMIQTGIFRGNIKPTALEAIMEIMIQKYVLCPKCKNPEWCSKTKCPACGFSKTLPISIPSDDEEVDDINDIRTCQRMHELYDERDRLKVQGLPHHKQDEELDRLWFYSSASSSSFHLPSLFPLNKKPD